MNWNYEQMYSIFSSKNKEQLLNGKWGIERELQRVTKEGDLALTPHPPVFGNKLKNKEITTDFAESQMELITPALSSVEEVDGYLKLLHKKAWEGVGDEYLWPLSMPPRLPEEEIIPIARFDDSREGRAAYIYRQGLANRYGKKMQMISGIHFNFSFGEELFGILYREFGGGSSKEVFKDELYYSVARNFLRYRFLLVYLFGASPAFDETYGDVFLRELVKIRKFCPECCKELEKYATSFRVSRFGYSNPVQGRYRIFYNSMEEYIQGIRTLLNKKSKKYARLGVQLNDKILQKDSEFYSPIRLKQIIMPGESQIDALEKRGVEYAEVRILDIDPFTDTGISLTQMRFLQVFLLFCLFDENRPIDYKEMNRINSNHNRIALSGRKPDVLLNRLNRGKISLKDWGEQIFDKLLMLAKLLDNNENKSAYSLSVLNEKNKLEDMSFLPSVKLVNEMYDRKESFIEFGMRKAGEYRARYR